MKGNKHGFRRVLAVLLSAMLMVSNLGLTAFAEEFTSEPVDAYADEEVFSSYAEAPSQDVDILLDDGTWEETQIIDEGSQDLFTDGTDDVYQQDAVLTEDPMVDDGSQDDPLIVEEIPDKQPRKMDVPFDENPMEEPAGQPADDSMGDPIAEAQPVSVVFDAVPETALVTVYPAATEEAPDPEAIPAQEDGSFLLLPGEYAYSAQAEGYVPVEAVPFTVTDDEQPMLISFEMEAVAEEIPEPVAFDQSRTVNGVVVTVKADPGVFPADAVLSVETVPVYQQQQADAAVDEVRGGNQNVAVSYTFDIKVIHPETGEEYQPAEGQTVSVSFALAEVADENLETQVYHVTEDETTGELAAESLDVNTEITPETGEATTAVVETDGFSIYTVEFTYNNLEYVLPGSTSVPMSEILTAVGLTGEVTAVEVSDASLFSASDKTGEWIVAAHQAFSTTEWMKVTINSVVYEITVTDDGEITTWAELQAAFNAGGTITLTKNVVAGENDGPLTVPSGKTVILDLKGFGVDRNLYEPTEDGYVLHNAGNLTIRNSSPLNVGTISGGYNDEYVEDGVVPFGYNRGGGIYNTGTLRLEGGDITGNRAKDNAGVFNDSGATFTMTGGMISENTSTLMGGAGVTNYGTFNMSGGTITGNSAVTRGGGVWSIGSFTMSGGTISNNTAGNNGGGLCVRYGTATISGGSITGNSATGATPGDENATVTGCGGGLYIDQGGEVTFTGGSITGNTAGTNGGDIYLNTSTSWTSSLSMSGSPVASVCLAEGKVITVTGAFASGADIAVSTVAGSGVITSGYGTNNGEVHPSQYFHASDASNDILLGDGEAVLGTGTVVNDVPYVARSWNGSAVVSTAQTRDAIAVPTNGNMTSGWYYLNSNVTKNGRVESITGDVHLILGDGYTLDVKGLYVPQGSTLTIYGQTAGTGKIYSHPSGGAAIGGYSGHDNGNIVIHGGTVQAIGADHCAAIGTNDGRTGGAITIYGGTVTATGGSNGAGIGGGRESDAGTITIYGGIVTATGKNDSAAIGGGDSDNSSHGNASNITIHGGTVTATSSGAAAGIGGADYGTAHVTILGGTVSAQSTGSGKGIGGGSKKTPDESTVILGYTDATKDSISITASSYGGTVTLEQPFAMHSYSRVFLAGAVTDNSLLGGGALTFWSGEINSWQTLQMAISGAQNGATITLTQDVSADYTSDAALHVASGKNFTLDLNGCTINRNLTNSEASVYGNEGYVIQNEGTLTITDTTGGGVITGGICNAAGGGIYNSGTLTLNGGAITGNASATWGGGIYLPDKTGAVLHLNGGSITNNTCGSNGGGVHVSGSASMTVSGHPVVTGNTKGSAANNINLAANALITVSGALTDGANLGVSASGGTATITSGYGANHGTTYPGAFFHADNANYGIALADGEAQIATPFTVTIPADDKSKLSVDKPSAMQGDTVTITVLDNTALSMISVIWAANGSTQHVPVTTGTGSTATFVMPGADVTVKVNPPVTYYQNGSKTYTGNYTVVTSDTTTWTTGWYVVNEDVTINERIEVTGVVNLVVMGKNDNDRCALDANAGIHVPDGDNALTIYGETANNGILRACSNGYALPDKCAAIGGNNRETNGPIIINSGFVGATSKGRGAAIGGGDQGSGVSITINGGNVLAANACTSEDKGGAGIGGGTGETGVAFSGGGLGDGRNITINGGAVTGYSYNGAGIGGGCAGCGYRITINGGTVNAQSASGAGIGGGRYAAGFAIKIYGGNVDAVSSLGGAGIGNGSSSHKKFPVGETVIENTIGGDISIGVLGGNVTASSSYLEGSGHWNSAFAYGDSLTPHIPIKIYAGAKITGGYSKNPTTVVDDTDVIEKFLNYVTIHPCTHEHATYEVISAETHLEQCEDCRTEFTEEAHTLGADGICTVCGYDSHSSYVFFNSNGGSDVEAQLVANGGNATRPEDPTWEGYAFRNWYLVTNAATGEHETDPFDFDTAINESITLIAVWNHEHDGITFQSWTSDSSLPSSAGSYFLTKDVTLTGVWSWNGGTLNLCLAGHTVTGNIDISSDALITVNSGTLNLFDEEGGTVTLVNARAATVAVETGGTFNLHDGAITSETNESSLQGVDVAGTFHMSGGRITGNPTGVRVKRGGAFTVSGSARVTGNTVNVDLTLGNGKIQIGGALSDDARIGVTARAGVFTNGLNGGGDTPNGTAANFFSDSDDYLVALNAAGEAMLETAHTVTFEPGDESATGYMPEMRVGSAMTLPACDYSVEGKVFKEWSVKIGEAEAVSKQPEETIEITADTTVTAVWEDATPAQYTVTIESDAGCVVTVYIEDSVGEGGSISSGDTVPAGTVLKVNARPKAGYRLTEEGTPKDSYPVDGNLTIKAASEKQKYALTLNHENGAEPTCTGAGDLTAIEYGTSVTVTAGEANEGYEFIGWYQTNGKRLTSSTSYTVSIYGNMTLEARYQVKTGIVTFMSNGNLQGTFTGTSITQNDFPADPTPYYGFTFTGWDKTVDEINTALASGNVTVTAQFAAVQQTITVTIYNGESEMPTTQEYTESQWISVTAESVSGKSFAWWTMDGNIVSYNTNLAIRISADCTLKAVYTTETVEAVGTALIKTATYNSSTSKLSFVSYLTVPDGASITAAGLVAASGTSAKYTPGTELTSENADYVKSLAKAVGTAGPVTYTWTKTSVSIGDTWYARPYVSYTYNGNTETIYGDMVTVHAGCDYDSSEKATAVIRSTSYNTSTRKASFVAYLTVPDGGTIVKAGLVAAPGTTFNASTTILTWDTATYKKALDKAVGTSGPVTYTWTKTGVSAGDVWYVRPYVIYTDAGGTEHTVYGELFTYTAGA